MKTLIDKRVHYFYQAVQLGGVRVAADALNIAPSAISRQIAHLEKELGMILLERGMRGAKPTEAGYYVLDYYRHTLEQTEVLESRISALQGMNAGTITISTGAGYVKALSLLITEFSAKYPQINIRISINSSNEIIRKVMEGESNFGILYNAIRHPKLKSHHRTQHPLHVFMAKNHILSQCDSVSIAQLTHERLALTDTTHGIRQLIERAEHEYGLSLTPTLLCNDMNLLKDYTLFGGVTLLPRFMLQPSETDFLITKPLSEAIFLNPESQIISRRGAILSPVSQALLIELAIMLKNL